jgi:hypothetical protein
MQNTVQPPTGLDITSRRRSHIDADSFFDHEEKEDKELKLLWIKPKITDHAEIKNSAIMEGYFEKQGKKTGVWKTRYYILTATSLAYKQVSCKKLMFNLIE